MVTRNCNRSTIGALAFVAAAAALATSPLCHGFTPLAAFPTKAATGLGYQSSTGMGETAIAVDDLPQHRARRQNHKMKVDSAKVVNPNDPSNIEFVSFKKADDTVDMEMVDNSALESSYPFAMMLQGSARYIADHVGETVVFHIPGDLIETPGFPQILDDIALAWLLGMKIVVVVGCRTSEDECSMEFDYAHECHNTLRPTDEDSLRQVEEEAGFVRFEIERRLNKSLRRQCGVSPSSADQPACSGNVVGGNFYTTQPFGIVRGEDFQHTGYASKVHVKNVQQALENNDIVLLTTIAPSSKGELVNVNGNHLAAATAKALEAHKLIYMSTHGKVLRVKGQEDLLQEVSLSQAKSLLKFHDVEVHKAGFAAFENARERLEPGAVELLLHLGWASWAVDRGVTRAHVVNPGDGALLEELFTAKHGANTCLFHDDELVDDTAELEMDVDLHTFLDAAAAQGSRFS